MMKKIYIVAILTVLSAINVAAQQCFFNLTADEVKIDSVIPNVTWSIDLPENYEDSVYTVTLLYPDYIDMAPSDVARYSELSEESIPSQPSVEWRIAFNRKKPMLSINVLPFACQDGKNKILVSYMLKVEAKPLTELGIAKAAPRKATAEERYVANSVLATGKWAKIRVPDTGVYELTQNVIRKAGFSDLSRVKVYGMGGNMIPEELREDHIIQHDDLKEVPKCIVDGKHYFWGNGPVSWPTQTSTERTRNPYSMYGYYFITESDEEPLTLSEADFRKKYDNDYSFYHALYEEDSFAWLHSGRNLYDSNVINQGASHTFTLDNPADAKGGSLNVLMSAGSNSTIQVELNDSVIGKKTITPNESNHDKAESDSLKIVPKSFKSQNKIKLTVLSGGPVRLDYISAAYSSKKKMNIAGSPEAEYVHNITNQNHHADPQTDMVIIIPTSQKLLSQAERLKAHHEEHDGMRVTIVPADELYNEFSSGTPDAAAYRSYLKMLYDRATDEADMPKYLLLFGDATWDNRMLTSINAKSDPNDYLLCYESENSFSETHSYVDDGFFCCLDDGEGKKERINNLLDVAVGRFPVTTVEGAKTMVDKTIRYVKNENAGSWQNVIMCMGDDGNNNIHMEAINDVADKIITAYHPEFYVKKVMWDVYERVSSSTGNTYPEVSKIIKQQQQNGALIMNYSGHGSQMQISHETALRRTDFENFTNINMPLWVTASCDIMPFDGPIPTIGESAVLNTEGGAVIFFGTTRTVYSNYNKTINSVFIRNVLLEEDGKSLTVGEAMRRTKNWLIVDKSESDKSDNKIHYCILGDPAIALNVPKKKIYIDTINGEKVSDTHKATMVAGSVATVTGHVDSDEPFNGIVSIVVRDTEETLQGRINETGPEAPAKPVTFQDRTKVLFSGSNTIKDGKFEITFAIPRDINYTDGTGLLNVFAVDSSTKMTAHGYNKDFYVRGGDIAENDSVGPSVYCYLNTPSFVNGGDVNATPHFVAQISDEDGVNISGSGIGHDLQLIVDGDKSKTYNLNENFVYEFGSYTNGTTYYTIPELTPGPHTLKFKAWDMFNNSSTATLSFNVVYGLTPVMSSLSCTDNPARTHTTFIITHDRPGSIVDMALDIMDMSGRLLWNHTERRVSTDNTYTYDWDLTTNDGHQLQTGVYLYRVRISSDDSEYTSKAKKLIIVK